MKKVFKIGLIIFFTGLILGLVGWFTGGGMSTVNKLYISDHLKLSVSNEKRSISERVGKFNNIQNNTDNYAMRVVSGDNYSVKINANSEKIPKYKIKNGTLFFDKLQRENGRFLSNNTSAPLIIVTIPRNKSLNKVTMDVPSQTQMNNFRALNVKINEANIQLHGGNIYLENTVLNKKSKLSTFDGDVRIKQSSFLNGGFIETPANMSFNTGKVKGILKIDNTKKNGYFAEYDDEKDDDMNIQSIKNVSNVNYNLISSKNGNNFINGKKNKRKLKINNNENNLIILNNYYGSNYIKTK